MAGRSGAHGDELGESVQHLIESFPYRVAIGPQQTGRRYVQGRNSLLGIEHEHGIGEGVYERRPGYRNDFEQPGSEHSPGPDKASNRKRDRTQVGVQRCIEARRIQDAGDNRHQ